MPDCAALLVTCDDVLLEEVLRLAAAAGIALEVVHEPGSALRSWSAAGVVLVGADQATPLAAHHPARRDQVHVVARGPVAAELFRSALELGATDVLELPASEAWLVETLTDIADGGARRALVVGVVGGSGGVGATTVACALALTAARTGPVLLADLDPLGPGLDRVLGVESAEGARWDALMESTGRFGSRSLREALPCRDGLAVLTWRGDTPRAHPLHAEPVREVLAAGARGSELLVLDLPRQWDPLTAEIAARCDHVLLVSGVVVPAVASAARVAALAREVAARLHLVVRRARGGLGADAVAATLGLPLLTEVGEHRRLTEQVDLGLGPVHGRRDPLGRAARETCARLLRGSVTG